MRSSLVQHAAVTLCSLSVLLLAGCGKPLPERAPVTGRVLYRGHPLKFGTVMFQPTSGQPATASIREDGSFELSTFEPGDGAVLGPNKVRITCFEGQDPKFQSAAGGEPFLGRSLIPERYTRFSTSDISVVVKAENEPIVFELQEK